MGKRASRVPLHPEPSPSVNPSSKVDMSKPPKRETMIRLPFLWESALLLAVSSPLMALLATMREQLLIPLAIQAHLVAAEAVRVVLCRRSSVDSVSCPNAESRHMRGADDSASDAA